jgi:hypothetical protein
MADKVDLSLTGQEDPSDKNYYLVKVSGLKLYNLYEAKFQWSFQDQLLNDKVKNVWSNGFTINTLNISALTKPKLLSTDIRRSQGNIVVTWSGVDYTSAAYGSAFKRIDVYVRNNSDASPYFQLLGFIDKVGGAFAFPANPNSYTIRLSAINLLGDQSVASDEFTISAITDAPSVPSGLSAAWLGTDFTVSFTHDTASSANIYLKEYIVKLIPQSPTTAKEFSLTPTTGSSQKFSLSLEVNQAAFGDAQTQFSGSIYSVDIYGNKSAPVSFSNTVYVSPLATPTITALAIANGYTISYPTQTSNVFNLISIEEIESSAGTAPSTGYSVVKTDRSNPSIVSAPNNNKRWVRARLNDKANAFTAYSNIVAVTPVSPVVVDIDGPPNVTSVSATGGIDSTGYLGFNAYADISWPAVTTGGIRGYRIRFSNDAGTTYSYVDSPGAGTTYRLGGLAVGATYKIAVATYDEYNNTSTSYISISPDLQVTGTPSITSYITAGPFQFGVGVGSVATNKGLYFDSSNYWYINASNSARLKVGGSTSNYLLWDGSEFVIDGNLSARKGTFRGNVSIISGGSLYSGTLYTAADQIANPLNVSGTLNGAGYILNSSGLTFNSSSVNGITTIDSNTGKLTTASAYIGQWDVNSSTLFKTTTAGTLSLNSSDATITANSTGYTSGVGVPDANNIVIWAGAAKATAPFRVYKDGTVIASQLTITGYATTGDIASFINAGQVNANVTSISGAVITTGVIKSNNFPGSNGQTANGAGYSTTGTAIDLVNGTITSPQFKIDSSGNASFAGALSSNVSITAPNIIGLTALSAGTPVSGIYPFYVDTDGKLTAKGAEISGVIQATGGVIGGWTINPTSLSASGMVLNAASQQIIFTNGFQIDNDNFTYDIAGSAQSSSSYYGSDTNTDGTVENSFVSSSPGTTTASSINIKPSSSYSGSSAALFMSTSGYSKLQAGGSYISLSSTGVVINTNTTGGIVLKGFTSAYHPMYNSAKEAGATLQIFSDGRVTAGRAFYKSGAAESSITNINHATWPYVGLIGDVIFSTAD